VTKQHKFAAFFLYFSFLFLFYSIHDLAFASTWQTLQVDSKLNLSVEVVSTNQEKRTGLAHRSELEKGKGMLFIYNKIEEQVFWMKGMLISIDIIWIRKGRVVHIEHSIPPPSPMTKESSLLRYGIGIYSDMVLEVPAGYAQEISLTQGSLIQLVP